jgi:micrococcal nuclease
MIRTAVVALLFLTVPAIAQQPQLEMCNGRPNTADKTCLVDGDTLWLNGENIRLKDFDTPEPQTALCGGAQEKALASMASARMLELLNSRDWTIEYFGHDSTSSKRRLATIKSAGEDVGDILIREHLARRWPDGEEWWCR